MKLIQLLFFIINIIFNVQAKTIEKRQLICSLKKKEHINMLLNKNVITIHDSEDFYHKYYHYHICDLIKDFIVNDSNSLELIKNEYLDKIYNIHNFPFTYRNNITLKISKDDIFKYNEEHCSEDNNYMAVFIILIAFLIMTYGLLNFFL